MIKLLIFDAGDLLWKPSKKEYNRVQNFFFKKYGIDGKVVNNEWKKIEDKVQKGQIKLDEANRIELTKAGLHNKKAVKEWKKLHWNMFFYKRKLNPGVKETLIKIKKNGYKLAILSDSVRESKTLRHSLSVFGMKNLFHSVFSSYDIGFLKPHRKAFFIVLNHFKVKPNEAIFVGHSKDEIEGARKLKIRTIAYKWDKGTKSDFYIKKFSEIPKILER
jgi:HAD superfamily hydrolase (TIGR01549 family)